MREEEVGVSDDRNGWGLVVALFLSVAMWAGLVFGIIFFLDTVAHAEEWSDDQIVEAIYKAEGGEKAQYPYGIRSVHCETKAECRKICKNTVKKNRIRFAEYGYRDHASFIDFLAERYCPTKGRNLSKAERLLNGNWKRNVTFFLVKGKGNNNGSRSKV